jgi:hypothetical protein
VVRKSRLAIIKYVERSKKANVIQRILEAIYARSMAFLNERRKGLKGALPTFIQNAEQNWETLIVNVIN